VIDRHRDSAPLHTADLLSQAAIDALPLALCVVDPAGELLAVNELFRDLFAGSALPRPLAAGANYLGLISRAGDDSAAHAVFVNELGEVLRGKRDSATHEYEWRSGIPSRWFEIRATRAPGDTPGRVIVTYLDITLLSAAQLRIAAFEATLAAAVAERTAHLIRSPIP
jgi:two-component system, sensor histidine kinase